MICNIETHYYVRRFILYIIFDLEISHEFWNQQSKQVAKEQFEREARIQIQQHREELARIERVRKQQLYNGDILYAYKQEQEIEFELVLETDSETENVVIQVDLLLVIHMKPHQSNEFYLTWNFL